MYIFKRPTVKLKLQKLWEILFSVFLKCAGKDNFKELIILLPKAFLTGGVPTEEFSIRIQSIPLDKQSCAFSSSNLYFQKSFFTWNYKFWQILIHTEKTRETIINLWYFIDVQFYFTARGILNTVICTAYFSDTFDSVFNKKRETFLCFCSIVCQKKEQIGYLEYSL